MPQQPEGPQVLVEQASRRSGSSPRQWLVAWRIRNPGREPLQLLESWVPHGRFRCGKRELSPPAVLPPGGATELELPVECDEPPGAVVENAFLILRVVEQEQEWRVLVRLTVTFDRDGAPESATESVTTQLVGIPQTE